jgi:chorismate mutase
VTAVRGIRGATTVAANEPGAITAATRELLETIVRLNGVEPADIASVWFTVTDDLDAGFPARAARDLGWSEVPLICAAEVPVPGAIERCVRVLVHWNTDRAQNEVRHAYLHGARALRPEWGL